jgi:hypothetical protein
MTGLGTQIATGLVTAAVAVGGALGAGADGRSGSAPRTALVIDAALARDGQELVDARLRDLDAAIRLPRNSTEAVVNVRYFSRLGYRLVVAGPVARQAADSAGLAAIPASGLESALAAGAEMRAATGAARK